MHLGVALALVRLKGALLLLELARELLQLDAQRALVGVGRAALRHQVLDLLVHLRATAMAMAMAMAQANAHTNTTRGEMSARATLAAKDSKQAKLKAPQDG